MNLEVYLKQNSQYFGWLRVIVGVGDAVMMMTDGDAVIVME